MVTEPDLLRLEKEPGGPEVVEVPETQESTPELEPTEFPPERREDVGQKEAAAMREAQEIAPASAPQPVVPKDPVLADVENILAEGLLQIYQNLPENKKEAFKKKGEQISEVVRVMVATGRIKAKRILDLIRDWLKLIPGINRFFLEQEAKIKTDKLVDYANDQIGKGADQLSL